MHLNLMVNGLSLQVRSRLLPATCLCDLQDRPHPLLPCYMWQVNINTLVYVVQDYVPHASSYVHHNGCHKWS